MCHAWYLSALLVSLKCLLVLFLSFFFFFNDTATTEIYTLSLHDALPIWVLSSMETTPSGDCRITVRTSASAPAATDRKSTRLNSSHLVISYAVFCLKKKKKNYACY